MTTATIPSTNHDPASDPWIIRLRSRDTQERDEAISELRNNLVRGLSRSFSQRYTAGLQAEDVAQEALIRILKSLDQFSGRSRFTTWAMTVAIRLGISEMRRKRYQDVSLDAYQSEAVSVTLVAPDDSLSTQQRLDQQTMVEKLQQLIESSLTPKQRGAIQASLDGVPVEVIAEKTGANRNSIYKLVHDARVKLRRALEEAGISATDFADTFA